MEILPNSRYRAVASSRRISLSPPSMSRDDSKAPFTALFRRELSRKHLQVPIQEAFTSPQLFAFFFFKEVISSWDVGLDRPQTTGRDSVDSELAQYKPSHAAYMYLATPWLDILSA